MITNPGEDRESSVNSSNKGYHLIVQGGSGKAW